MAKLRYLNYSILILLFLILYFVPIDPDLGWHLRMGEFIVESRSIPWSNLFSYTLPNYLWADSYWLTQIIIYALYKYGGLLLLSFVFTVLGALSVVLGVSGEKVPLYRKYFVALLFSVLLSKFFLCVRPVVISSMFFVITWNILKGYEYRNNLKNLIFLPVIFLIWANVHAEFIPGLMLVGGFLFVDMLNLFFKRSTKNFKNSAVLFLSLLLSLSATFVNPYKDLLWQTLLKETNSLQLTFINEWRLLSAKEPYIFGMYIVLLSLTFMILWYRRKELALSEFLAILFVGILSARFAYGIRIFLLIALGLWVRYFSFETFLGRGFKPQIRMPRFLKYFATFYGAAFVLLLLVNFAVNVKTTSNEELVFRAGNYPIDALNYMQENHLDGRIFNEYGWGGFLIWQIPETKTFIDGRMPSWREGEYSVFADYIDIVSAKSNAGELIRKYKIDYFLIPKDSALSNALSQNNFWKKSYEDGLAVIFYQNR